MYERTIEQVESELASLPECRSTRLDVSQLRNIDGFLASKNHPDEKISEILAICTAWADGQGVVCRKASDIDVSGMVEAIKEIGEVNSRIAELKKGYADLIEKVSTGSDSADLEVLWKAIDGANHRLNQAEKELENFTLGENDVQLELEAVTSRIDHVENRLRERYRGVSYGKQEEVPVASKPKIILTQYELTGEYDPPYEPPNLDHLACKFTSGGSGRHVIIPYPGS